MLEKYFDGLEILFQNGIKKYEKIVKRKANNRERNLIADNIATKLINYYTKNHM